VPPTASSAAVLADIRRRLPFVPALFERLVDNPEALAPAWLQARGLYESDEAQAAAELLRATVDPGLPYRASAAVRAAVEPFAQELPMLLLVVSSLWLSLNGELPVVATPELPDGDAPPISAISLERGEHELFPEIREVYGMEHVPHLYRALAAQGVLEEPWRAIGPSLAGARGIAMLREAAERAAARLTPEAYFADEPSRPLLEQLRRALPRNLVFAVAATAD
jgi:hypothetical protein